MSKSKALIGIIAGITAIGAVGAFITENELDNAVRLRFFTMDQRIGYYKRIARNLFVRRKPLRDAIHNAAIETLQDADFEDARKYDR